MQTPATIMVHQTEQLATHPDQKTKKRCIGSGRPIYKSDERRVDTVTGYSRARCYACGELQEIDIQAVAVN